MNKRFRSLLVIASAMLAMLALAVGPAVGQEYPPPGPDFSITCTDAEPGGTMQCSVVGAAAGEVLSITASSDGVTFFTGQVTANEDGEASFSIDIPTDVLGVVMVAVEGPISGTASDTAMVAPADDDDAGTPVAGAPVPGGTATGQLPFTGGEVGALLAMAIVLLGGGLLALRRREDAKVSA